MTNLDLTGWSVTEKGKHCLLYISKNPSFTYSLALLFLVSCLALSFLLSRLQFSFWQIPRRKIVGRTKEICLKRYCGGSCLANSIRFFLSLFPSVISLVAWCAWSNHTLISLCPFFVARSAMQEHRWAGQLYNTKLTFLLPILQRRFSFFFFFFSLYKCTVGDGSERKWVIMYGVSCEGKINGILKSKGHYSSEEAWSSLPLNED